MPVKRLLLLSLLFLLACSPTFSADEDIFGETAEADKKFQGFNLQGYTDEGEKEWDVKGETADVMGTKIKLSNVDANAYGDQNVNVTAETGTIDQVSGEMRLEKDVVITSAEGAQLTTDSLDWNREQDTVSTEDDVMITDKRMTVTGKGLKGRPGLKTAEIQKDVTVMVNTDEDPQKSEVVTITSEGPMVIDQANSVAVFNDKVVAIQKDRTLRADRMEVYFDLKINEIKEIICIGNVVIEQGENRTYAERAAYNAKDQKLILSGRPKLIFLPEGENGTASFGNKKSE